MNSRTRIGMMLVAGALALAPSLAGAGDTQQDFFGVRWEPHEIVGRLTAVQGYVDNHSPIRVGDVRLRVDTLDDHGTVISESFGWVLGDIPANGRAYFLIRIEVPGPTYHVTIESFDRMTQTP